jgi:heme-degrading monooxygenase HmoA
MLIARTWRGETPADKADAYLEYLHRTGLADFRRSLGNRGVLVERRIEKDRAVFILTSFWESFDAIRAFAGDDYERARYYPADDDFLLVRETFVSHGEIVFHDLALASAGR